MFFVQVQKFCIQKISLTFVWYNMQTEILAYKFFKLKFPSFLMVSLNQHNVNDIRFILAYDIKYVLILIFS